MLRPFGHSASDMLVVVGSSFKMVKFEPATANMSQHVATGWPNASNMLRPTMLWYVALNCCGLLVDRGLSKSFKSCLRFVCDSAGRRMSKMCYNCDLSESNSPPLNADQTESQVDASWELASTCDSVWPGLESLSRLAPLDFAFAAMPRALVVQREPSTPMTFT